MFAKTWEKLKILLALISPILIYPENSFFRIRFSKRFFLFSAFQRLKNSLELDPYLNFISALKYYKVLGKFLHGEIEQLHKERNFLYFKNFFYNKRLYEIVKADLQWVYLRNKKLKLTLTKNGVIIYDNYKPNAFNTLLLTLHSGNWMPKSIEEKQFWTKDKRIQEEDTDTHKIYADIVLKKNGIWIDNKLSRFACDYNRSAEKCIYQNNSETWLNELWKEPLNSAQKKLLMTDYQEFYFTLSKLIQSYNFNLILDGHSMRNLAGRPDISFGTKFIPKFYMPIVQKWLVELKTAGYPEAKLDSPYSGGNIVEWLNGKFPNIFIAPVEINKKLYMENSETQSNPNLLEKLADDFSKLLGL